MPIKTRIILAVPVLLLSGVVLYIITNYDELTSTYGSFLVLGIAMISGGMLTKGALYIKERLEKENNKY